MRSKKKLFNYIKDKWTGYQHPDGWEIQSVARKFGFGLGTPHLNFYIATNSSSELDSDSHFMHMRRVYFFRRLERMYSIDIYYRLNFLESNGWSLSNSEYSTKE